VPGGGVAGLREYALACFAVEIAIRYQARYFCAICVQFCGRIICVICVHLRLNYLRHLRPSAAGIICVICG
jgi:hypothetical protein